ncbi:type II secretion system secretin GspD [Candidatus Kuenenia sp.]|uniref:type II secretion system secretin GspD n=1 Tax=Candidatus Kuenenia sp. TaxID=2499824 RepID=UPI003220262F
MNKCTRVFIMIVFALLSGCKQTQIKQTDFTPFRKPISLSTTTEKVEKKSWEYEVMPEKEVLGEKKEGIPDEIIYPSEYRRPEPALYKPAHTGEKIDIALNFDDAEIKDVVQVILGEILNVNYVLDKRVGGKVNLHASGEVYREELLSMLNSLLYVYNFTILKDGNLYNVLPQAEARRETSIIIHGDKIPEWSKDIIIQIVPLRYADPKKLSSTVKQFMSSIGNIVTHEDFPYLMIIDNASVMEKLLTIIKIFDVPFLAGKAMRFYEFKYVDARNMSKDLGSLAKSLGAKVGGDGEFDFVPFSDTNKLIVITKLPELLPKIDMWIKNIDVPPTQLDEEMRVYIYKVQHQKAETIVPIITQMYSEKMAAQPKKLGRDIVESMKVLADIETNSVIIKTFPSDYKSIKAIIEAIDATPQQVFIEVLIVEVTRNDTLDYGTEWLWSGSNLQVYGVGDIARAAGNAAVQFTNTFAKGSFEILMDILAVSSNAKILSAPHILVRDEQPASIQVGEEVPILTGSGQQTGTTVTFEQVQYRDTGIILTVTPHIAENGLITLEVNQEVSNAQETTTGVSDSPTFSTRQVQTSLVIKSGHTIGLGGIIEQKNEKSVSKIPLLGDIPYLGNLFKVTSLIDKRTELIMLITPYIANNAEDADSLTQAFERKLQEIDFLLNQ